MLRSQLEPDDAGTATVLVADRQRVRLAPGDVDSDVARLERAVRAGDAQRLRRHHQDMAAVQAAALQRERQAFQVAQAARDAARRRAPATGGGSSVLDSNHASWKRRHGMTDEGGARVVDGIHERTAWRNTDGQTTYLPQRYQRAYQLHNEDYVGSNDAFFSPMQGTELQLQRR